jgi:hypothetical protein
VTDSANEESFSIVGKICSPVPAFDFARANLVNVREVNSWRGYWLHRICASQTK